MAKKKKIDNRDPSINLRLPKPLKEELQEKAHKRNQTVSMFVRALIENYLSGELCKEQESFYKRHHFVTSLEFIQLLVWIYKKRESKKYIKSDEEVIPNLLYTLKQTEMYLPKDIAQEFDKVLFDILKNQKMASDNSKNYGFSLSRSNNSGFDYVKFEDYLENIKNPESKSR